MKDSKERFTHTADHYQKYRPSYPKDVINILIEACGLNKDSIVADIGSGTGIFTKMLLSHAQRVFAVEPNKAMRLIAENELKNADNFKSINGSSEATTLKDHSIDIITAATAFHWFDSDLTKKEFRRILKSDGWVVLVWNVRDLTDELVRNYEALLLEFCPDYARSKAIQFDKSVGKDFFAPCEMFTKSFFNKQLLDWNGFKGRLLSTSYCLSPSDTRYDSMLKQLKKIFDTYEQDGHVNFIYQTKLYYGQLWKN